MRWPSAYWATSRGTSRSTMRMRTQPTCPEELRTRYQSSMTGLGCSESFGLSAAVTGVFVSGTVGGGGGAAGGGFGFALFSEVAWDCADLGSVGFRGTLAGEG